MGVGRFRVAAQDSRVKARRIEPLDTQPITVRLSAEFVQKIDDIRKTEPDLPTRPEMMRRMMEEWVSLKGHD